MMRIPDYFAGKSVFITGGTGFLGKALIEKLLRSCPDLENIYVLMRAKKGKSAQERLADITDNPVFDVFKESDPIVLNKLVAIDGDVTKLKLGIDEGNRRLLAAKVNYVYHMAATVRFDDNLKDAIITNIRSTRDLMELIYEMKNLLSFVHVSTTYCHIEKTVIEEKIYPPHGDWQEAIRLAEGMDGTTLEILTQKYIQPLPNTYTFTKRLAETLIVDMCTGKIPTVIARPSIITSTVFDPVPGWIDNFNGPIGLAIASAKGILRIVYAKADIQQDYVCVDMVCRALVVIAAQKAATRDTNEIGVYNISKYNEFTLNTRQLNTSNRKLNEDIPLRKVLWYPRTASTSCWYNYYLQVILFHVIPALFLDLGLRLAGKKPMFFKIQKKIFTANYILYPFMSKGWDFLNDNMHRSFDNLMPEDLDGFGKEKFCNWTDVDLYAYYCVGKIGAVKYLLKENLNRDADVNLMRKRWLLDVAVKSVLGLLLLWYLLAKVVVYIGL